MSRNPMRSGSSYDYGRYDRLCEQDLANERAEAEIDAARNGFKPVGECIQLVVARLQTAYEIAPQCESPIEIILGASLILINEREHGGKVDVIPQAWFHRYRFDWALGFPEMERPVLFVECDGAEWHSTPEQIANDKAKDAAALEAGIEVVRFSGSDIFRNPDGCARVALGLALQKA